MLDKSGFVGKVRVARGAAHTDRSYYWPNGTIPYVMWPALELDLPSYRRRIESAIWEIELHSCVRFVEKRSEDEDYVVLYDSLGGCYSDIGRQGGAQITAVGRGCSSRGNVLHELLHTVGMWHTIARIDRDKHIRVNWDNMDVSSFKLSLHAIDMMPFSYKCLYWIFLFTLIKQMNYQLFYFMLIKPVLKWRCFC